MKKLTTQQKKTKEKITEIEFNTAGQKELVLSFETFWLLLLMSTKCQGNIWSK